MVYEWTKIGRDLVLNNSSRRSDCSSELGVGTLFDLANSRDEPIQFYLKWVA